MAALTALIDTSVLIGEGSGGLADADGEDGWAVSVVAIGELEAGVLRANEPEIRAACLKRLTAVLGTAPVLNVDQTTAARYGELRAPTRRLATERPLDRGDRAGLRPHLGDARRATGGATPGPHEARGIDLTGRRRRAVRSVLTSAASARYDRVAPPPFASPCGSMTFEEAMLQMADRIGRRVRVRVGVRELIVDEVVVTVEPQPEPDVELEGA